MILPCLHFLTEMQAFFLKNVTKFIFGRLYSTGICFFCLIVFIYYVLQSNLLNILIIKSIKNETVNLKFFTFYIDPKYGI